MKLNSRLANPFLVAILALLITLNPALAKGNLFIIGGGKRPAYMVKKIISLAGGSEKSNIVIVPMASSVPVESALWQRYDFEKAGSKNIRFAIFDSTSANSDSILSIFEGANAVYFSGGDQSRLTRALLGTKLLDKISDIYRKGGVIAGTSAGAAVMSKVMITGNELINTDSTRSFIDIKKGNIEFTEGFDFLPGAIIDQHFIKRKRVHRLLSLVLQFPDLLGIGLDESTAIWVKPDNTFEVVGENSVMILDASDTKSIRTDLAGNFGTENVKLHLLIAGQKFDLKEKALIP